MSGPSSAEASSVGAEPIMYLQRPSSARSQDVSHVLARTFRDLFMRDAVGSDTVHYLTKSRGGENDYHEAYVEALQQVQDQRDQRMAQAAMLERHIMQAQARAMSADERELNRVSSGVQKFPDLGLPPARAHFRSCIDVNLLRKHNLICPEDFATEEMPPAPPPQEPDVPNYARETMSSSKKKPEERDPSAESPLIPEDSDHMKKSTDSLSSLASSANPYSQDQMGLKSQVWKDQLNPEEREVNRTDLANLQARVDYLKNPRHGAPSVTPGAKTLIKAHKKQPKEVGIKPTQEKTGPKEPSVIFIPSPSAVVFSNYRVGHVYELTLELKNVTTVLRPVRIVPPKTSYFSVGLGQFPGEKGLVAPGMSCHYTIRFAPDSLADYDDVLEVQTQSRTPITIPIQGRRPPPVLMLPDNINIGQCLIGGCKVARISVTNVGGSGRFCLMPRSSWPATNFKSVMAPGCVLLPPFEVRPAVFELETSESLMLEILFTPDDITTYTQGLTMVCDNCHVRHFTIKGEGQTANCELVSMEGGVSQPVVGEICDISAQHLIRFENLNPYTYYQRRLTIKNQANVEVPYNWVVVKPVMKPPDPAVALSDGSIDTSLSDMPQDRIHDSNSPFSVEPDSGVLAASAEADFVITFAPPEVKDYHSVLHFVLRDVPVPKTEAEKAAEAVEAPRLTRTPSAKQVVSQVQDVTAMELELKGICEPFSVILQPYAIYIPGQVLINTAVKRPFRMVNLSISSVVFEWEKCSSSYIIEVEPPVGELGPQGEIDFELTVTGSVPGKVDHTLLCNVHHLAEPLMLHVEAEIKGPEVVIENANLNFGLIKFGDTIQETITIRNVCQVPARWRINESKTHMLSSQQPEFIFMPPCGELRPLEQTEVRVICTPGKERSMRTVIDLQVEDGNSSALAVRGEVQSPQACLLSCELRMEEVFLDVPVIQQVTLLNQTLLPTTFEWGELSGDDSSMCSVSLEPASGVLDGRQQVEVSVHYTAHRQGVMTDLHVACYISGMRKPLILALSSKVQGLSVSYRTPIEDEEGHSVEPQDLGIHFDSTTKLGSSPMRRLYIRNKTAITAPFNLSVETFGVRPPTPPDKKPGFMPGKTQRRALLGKTPNLADPLSKTPTSTKIDLAKTMLQAGMGAAFSITPSSGVLQPFGEQIIEIHGYSDMWGQYKDTLVCKVEKLDLVHIPVQMGVQGCPLLFQMVAAQPDQKPVLRFGTHASGVRAITRQMRINNISPLDIRLDWQIFNEDSQDAQLLDFIMSFGDNFPLRDKKGNEIVPPAASAMATTDDDDDEAEDSTSKSSLRRYPTEFIPNSAETTPAASRQVTSLTDNTVSKESDAPFSPKVISVTLRGHGGKQATAPYSINPSQVIVPGHGNGCISVAFTPPPNDQVNGCSNCLGFALGYMSLEKGKEQTGHVTREQGYAIEPLRLDMTAQVKPALLTIECSEDEGMCYRAAASDLDHHGSLIQERLHVCSATLSNQTETPLVFRLVTCEPFQLVELDSEGRPVKQLIQTDFTTLRPRQNAVVQVAFRVSLDLLNCLHALEDSERDTSAESADANDSECTTGITRRRSLEGVELETHEHERKLHFKQQMVVEFSNNTMQKLPLLATLTVPTLVMAKESLDFGICYVGQQRELQFLLKNPTGSDSYWMTRLESQSTTCTGTTFEVTPSQGKLEAHITHVSNSQVLIKVFFTAKHTEEYEAVYVFQGMLGEQPRRLYLRGLGSYDGKHEALVNI